MKKIICLMITLLLLTNVVACGSDKQEAEDITDATEEAKVEEDASAEGAEQEEVTETLDIFTNEMQVAEHTISIAEIPFDKQVLIRDVYLGSIATGVDDTIWLTTGDDDLLHYKVDEQLSFIEEKEVDIYFNDLLTDANGNLYLSGTDDTGVLDTEGNFREITDNSSMKGSLTLSSDASWGLKYFVTKNLTKIAFDGTTITDAEDAFPVTLEPNFAKICDDQILAAGQDDVGAYFTVMDLEGNELFYANDGESEEDVNLDAITGAIRTENGYIVYSSSMSTIGFWDNAGNFIAEIDEEDLFQNDFMCINTLYSMPDGSILVLIGRGFEGTDEYEYELLVYRLTGF